jgi:chromosome segregation protein
LNENKNAEVNFNQLIAEENEIKVGLERKLGEARNLQNTIKQSEDNIQNINSSIVSRRDDIEYAKKEISDVDNQISKHESEVGNLENAKKSSMKNLKVERDYEELKANGSSKEAAIDTIRTEKDNILDANRDLEIKLSEFEIKKNNLIEHINEEYSLKIERKKFDDNESFDFETHKAEVHDLRQKIRNLGPINLLAYSEFEEERERLEFLSKQRDDLVESEKDIVKTIEEINLTAQSKFAETFNQIKENFIKYSDLCLTRVMKLI